ncbi:MAG: VWA domain-containing protein [Verrucomicrobia bacterium]|nr:VWA domain-containing protein [Verrucomicrobiota bacterium]
MDFQFVYPHWLWLLPPVGAWIVWLTRTSFVQLSPARRWFVCGLRLLIALAMILALAGFQWRRPIEGLNVFFLLDQSDSVPESQQEQARLWINRAAAEMPTGDRAGALVFGTDAAIEASPGIALNLASLQAVVATDRTDIGAAIRLATAAFPETGQRRIVLLSDGNENFGDALSAALSARASGVSLDVLGLGTDRGNDVSVQRLEIPSTVGKGQAFDVKVFVQADQPGPATVRFYRNEQYLGERGIQLEGGKNLLSFPQSLIAPGFYSYDVRVESPGDRAPQNNRAFGFASVRGVPRVLMISNDAEGDTLLSDALKASELDVTLAGVREFPASLAELQSYDSVVFCNVAAGELSREQMRLLEVAVRDFGVGFVCVGGDEAYAAGAYRNTPLETILPVNMELSSRQVLPPGALVLVIDKSGSMTGEKIEMVKQAAIGAVLALSDWDYIGVLAFDGAPYIVAEIQPARNKQAIIRSIAGITADGGTSMYPPMVRAQQMLASVTASLKHCIVLTDGVSESGDFSGITQTMSAQRITLSTVGVGTDTNEELLQELATLGRGRYYPVPTPAQLPQIFIKETAIVLKTAINEEPFIPRLVSATEPVRGIAGSDYPMLLGYVATEPKPRAEVPLVTDKGDPLLAHWQHGLARTVAFTSDARAKWAVNWTSWPQYRQFWRQVVQWSLRRLANADFVAEAVIESGEGRVRVDALDDRGDFRNFLNLHAVVVGPKGDKQTVILQQIAPGGYEASFPARDTGAYLLNVMEMQDGQPRAAQIIGTSLAYSPELTTRAPNTALLQRLAEVTGGRVIDPARPAGLPFQHGRKKTYQAQDLWSWLLKFCVVAFVIEVGIRRVQIDRDDWRRFTRRVGTVIFFWRKTPGATAPTTPSLAALLTRRDAVRAQKLSAPSPVPTQSAAAVDTAPGSAGSSPASASDPSAVPEATAGPEAQSTTNRLLAAKRRARHHRR